MTVITGKSAALAHNSSVYQAIHEEGETDRKTVITGQIF